jgi:hypothetical protein
MPRALHADLHSDSAAERLRGQAMAGLCLIPCLLLITGIQVASSAQDLGRRVARCRPAAAKARLRQI